VPIFRRGQKVYQSPALETIRQRTGQQLAMFHSGIKRLVNPHQYPVGLELGLNERKQTLILQARGFNH
jgi:nicotinate phosphoribosyltransferase